MKCGSLKKKIGNNICFNPDEELILSGDMSEDDRYSAIIDHYKILLARKDLMMSVKRFNDLYAIVKEASIKGIGELCIYDTTERIGTFLGVLPDEVYLHRGTRVGAVRLLGKVKNI